MPNRINHNLAMNSANNNMQQTHLLTLANNKHDAIQKASETTNAKLDTLSGAINNNIGDAQVKLQTYVYGYDSPNGLARPLAVTSNGELKVSNDVLEVSAETVNLNTDTLEAKIQATNDKIDGLSGAGNNNIGEGQSKLQTYLYARDVAAGNFKPLVCDGDAHLQVDVLSSAAPTGAATETTLAAAEVHLGNIETAVQLSDDVVTVQNAAHPSKANAVGGRYYVDNTFRDIRVDDIGKVIVDSPAGSDINTRLDAITTGQTSGSQQAKIMGSEDGSPSGTQRQVHVDGSGNLLTSIVSSVNVIPANSVNSHITDDPANSMAVGLTGRQTIGTATTQTHLLCDSDGHLQVDVLSAPTPTGAATESTLAAAEVHLGNIETKMTDGTQKMKQSRTNSSEVVYVSGQSVSGSSSFTGSAISVDPNTFQFMLEHNFSNTAITYEILHSIDGTNYFDTGISYNGGVGPSPPSLTGLNQLSGSFQGMGFAPFIKIRFSNGDASAQTVTLSYVQQLF